MSPFAVRLGVLGGWLGLIGVVGGLIVIPTAIAGQPPTSSSDLSAVRAYFAHPQLGIQFGLVNGFVAIAFVMFGLGLRAAVGGLIFLVWFVAIVVALTRFAARSTVATPSSIARAAA